MTWIQEMKFCLLFINLMSLLKIFRLQEGNAERDIVSGAAKPRC